MSWFWLRSRRHRRVTSAGGLAHDSAGQPAWRKAARRIGYAWLGVVLAAAAAGCTASPGSTGQGQAATAASSSLFISRAVPDAPVGRQLTWYLRALADLPLSQQVIRAHFDPTLLAHISPEQLNSALAQPPAPGGAALIGLLSEDPARDPVSLLAVAAFGSVTLTVDIAVDHAGLDGTQISVLDTAAKMISISDNTAANMLINLVGRSAVQAQDRQWSDHAALNVPFLTTREAFILKLSQWPALANRYIAADEAGRQALLASTVDPAPLPDLAAAQAWATPRDIDTIEWFASPDDICRALAGLQQLAAQPRLAPLGSILSANNGGVGLDPAQWPAVWFKGGSEPGVLTLSYLATNSKGQTFVVVAMLNAPAAALFPSAEAGLLAIARGAFELDR